MTDLIALLGSLVDANGRIKVPGVYDSVAELTSEEEKLYGPIDFSMVSGDIKKTNKLVKVLNKICRSIMCANR